MTSDTDKMLANLNQCLQHIEQSIEILGTTVFTQKESIIYSLREMAFETRLSIAAVQANDMNAYVESAIRRDYLEAEAQTHIKAG